MATNNEQDINISRQLAVRLRQLVDTYERGNVSAFALLTGVKRPALIDYLEERRNPSVNVIAKIKVAIPDIDLNWLLNPADIYRNTSLGDKIWLVSDEDGAAGYKDDSAKKEIALLKENNNTLKEYNDVLKGQMEFYKAKYEELLKTQQG